MKKLNKKGTLMIVTVLFLLLFSSVAVALEASLVQRVESRRYAERNNGIYTADAMLDFYIYAAAASFQSPCRNYTVDTTFSDDKLNDLVEEMGASICRTVDGKLQINLKDIASIVQFTAIDKPELTNSLLDIIIDQSQVTNYVANAKLFQINWEDEQTIFHGNDSDRFVLKPIEVVFKEYYKSYTVEKSVIFYGVKLVPRGEGPTFSLAVNIDDIQIIVKEYNCHDA